MQRDFITQHPCSHYVASRYIEDRSFRRFVESCLEETIVVYVDHLLTQRNCIRQETIERMRLDEEVLLDFFQGAP
ncbi:unnamed protein product [Musa banksii]